MELVMAYLNQFELMEMGFKFMDSFFIKNLVRKNNEQRPYQGILGVTRTGT